MTTSTLRTGASCVPTSCVVRRCPPSASRPATSHAVALWVTPTRGSFVTPAVFAVGCCACATTTDKQANTINQHTLLPAFTLMLLFIITFQTRWHRGHPAPVQARLKCDDKEEH